MKAVLSTLILSAIVALSASAQEDSFNDFRKEFNRRDGVHHFTVPGFLVRLVGSIALEDESDAMDRETLRPILRNLGSVSVVFTDEGNAFTRDDILDLRRNLRDENFETLVKVRDEHSQIEVLSYSKRDVIKRLFFIIQDDDDETVLLNIRGHFTPHDVDEMIYKLEKKERHRM